MQHTPHIAAPRARLQRTEGDIIGRDHCYISRTYSMTLAAPFWQKRRRFGIETRSGSGSLEQHAKRMIKVGIVTPRDQRTGARPPLPAPPEYRVSRPLMELTRSVRSRGTHPLDDAIS